MSLWGCQSYDFERVTPLAASTQTTPKIVIANALSSNVMLLLDNSQSMSKPISAGGPSRVDELKLALSEFLGTSPTRSRFGLSIFPEGGGASCAAPQGVQFGFPPNAQEDDQAGLAQRAAEIDARVQLLVPEGGTPTAAALRNLLTVPELTEVQGLRDDVVVLVTDGVPNCNEANPNNLCACGAGCSTAQTSACACTSSACAGSTCAVGCLDADDTLAALRELRQRGIRTAIVGFGSDLVGAEALLQQMAQAGGYARSCEVMSCGAGDSCDGDGLCGRAWFQASNHDELIAAFKGIGGDPEPCRLQLTERPSDPLLIEVRVGGTVLPRGGDTWSYDAARNLIQLEGATCAQAEASTTLHPFAIEVSVAQKF